MCCGIQFSLPIMKLTSTKTTFFLKKIHAGYDCATFSRDTI